MAKVLVTGGAGFIGSWTANFLLEIGHKVCVIDRLSTGKRSFLFKSKNLFFYKFDFSQIEKVKQIIKEFRPNYIIHLAAIHFIPYCELHSRETIENNIINFELFLKMLEQLKLRSLKKILIASSAAVYPPDSNKHKESDQVGPDDLYGLTKYVNELQLLLFHQKTSVPSVILRIFNGYGPQETNPHLIPEIIKQLKRRCYKIQIGNIKTKRSYIYVKDIAQAIIRLIEANNLKKFDVFNIGSKAEYSAQDIINQLSELIGKRLIFTSVVERKRKKDRMRLQPDLTKIKRVVGWTEKYNLKTGLKELLEFEKII